MSIVFSEEDFNDTESIKKYVKESTRKKEPTLKNESDKIGFYEKDNNKEAVDKYLVKEPTLKKESFTIKFSEKDFNNKKAINKYLVLSKPEEPTLKNESDRIGFYEKDKNKGAEKYLMKNT